MITPTDLYTCLPSRPPRAQSLKHSFDAPHQKPSHKNGSWFHIYSYKLLLSLHKVNFQGNYSKFWPLGELPITTISLGYLWWGCRVVAVHSGLESTNQSIGFYSWIKSSSSISWISHLWWVGAEGEVWVQQLGVSWGPAMHLHASYLALHSRLCPFPETPPSSHGGMLFGPPNHWCGESDRTKYLVGSADHMIRHSTSTRAMQHLRSWFFNGISFSAVNGMILLQDPRRFIPFSPQDVFSHHKYTYMESCVA